MADEWDDVLKEIESLKEYMGRIVDAITLTASDLVRHGKLWKKHSRILVCSISKWPL
jgi:hypothetical protein